MNDYVSKPVNPQALADALERWLSENDRGSVTVDGRPRTEDGKPTGTEDRRRKTDDRGGSTSLTFPVPGLDLLSKSSSSPVIFDKAALKQRLMDDDELVGLVIAGFLEDIPLQIQALKSYLEAGDATGAERQAHTIKGAAANIGGEALRGIAYELEKLGKSGDLLAVQERMGELEAQFARLRDVLAKEI
jgi:HPt (histidine-containing phosphotransfer) domain-containing protein